LSLSNSFRNSVRFLLRRLQYSGSKLPDDLPPPFIRATNIGEVRDYFRGYRTSSDPSLQSEGPIAGFCAICDQEVSFEVDRPPGGGEINWRETLKCPGCGLINRWRGSLHLFKAVCNPSSEDRIYITESLSPVNDVLSTRYRNLVSSEYVPGAEPGEIVNVHTFKVRNEDVTGLSFDDNSFDALLTFDVLEHVPEYGRALKEFHRVLDFGGHLILTAPFNFSHETVVRAVVNAAGEIEHLVEPCYHGDPMSDEGVLAYYDFGMELLDRLKDAGFRDCYLVCYTSNDWGYPSPNVAFVALK